MRSLLCIRLAQKPKEWLGDASCSGSCSPTRACRARCLCLPARASILLKIRCFRGNFLLPALHAHILHMQAIWHSPAPHADKGTGGSRAGRALEASTNLPRGATEATAHSSLPSHAGEVCSLGISSWLKAECPGALLGLELFIMAQKPRLISGGEVPTRRC